MLTAAEATTLWTVLVVLTGVVVLALLWRLGVPFEDIQDRLETRLILGIPWGTIVIVAGLFGIYLFVQRGWWHWYRPVVVAFTAVSMGDPVGWLLAGLSHSSPGHLRSNVTSTLVFAPIVEWIWGHYPPARDRRRWPQWVDRPGVRALVLFPLGVWGLAIVGTLFSWGPVIGFSLAVFALIGIALVHFPVLTIVALVVREAVRTGWRTITDPVQMTEVSVRVVEPSWFGTAVQGHLVGLLLGVIAGLWLLERDDRIRPAPGPLFVGALLVGVSLSVWALWWITGPDAYILFRAAGVILVIVVAALITVGVSPARTRFPPYGKRLAIGVLIVAVIGMGVVGIGLNLLAAEPPPGEPAASVEDYDIYYGEEIPDGMVNIVDIEALGLTTDVRTSGVVVYSEERNVWRRTVSTTQLQTYGERRFTVGGLGWSEELWAVRRGWQPAGNDSVYHVWIGDGDSFDVAHTSDPKTARPVLANRSFTIAAAEGSFYLEAEYQEGIQRTEVPDPDETRELHNVQITREEDDLVARFNGSTVAIASVETYE